MSASIAFDGIEIPFGGASMKLPKGWKLGRVSDFGTVITGSTPSTADAANFHGNVPFVTPGDIGATATIVNTGRTLTKIGADKCRIVPAGSTLVVCIGATIGKVGFARRELVTNQQINAVVPNGNMCGGYVFHEIGRIGPELKRLAGTQAIPILSKTGFSDFPVVIPPLPEQRRIAEILGAWDNGLEKLDAMIAAKERRKKGLMQQLLTGKRRMKGFEAKRGDVQHDRFGAYPGDWRNVSLGKITTEVISRNVGGQELPVLSCTKHEGLVLSEEYFGRRVYADDTSAYRVVPRNHFAYATNHIEEGSIGYQTVCNIGLVSPIYTVFQSKPGVDDRYLFRVLKSPLLVHLYRANTSASVNRRGGLRYDEFAKISVWLPPLAEQRAIADILDTCDEELRLLRARRAAMEKQKRGLMQRLLTGRVRAL
jgi:type I restriction enzyme S subunit